MLVIFTNINELMATFYYRALTDDGRIVSNLSSNEKNKLSHRYQASFSLKKKLDNYKKTNG